ncbi:MAG: hypothetical protein J4F45_02235 [Pseudomonadales bacterium]|nr:hypothetical protein [Pseudomonadales bacterium]
MGVLHILSNPDATASCVAAVAEGDAIVVVGDGVFALPRVATSARIGVVTEDAADRGVGLPDGVQSLSYADFVAWVVGCRSSVTWT